jgi:hypothetical protein
MQLLNRTAKRRFDSSDILPLFAIGTLGIQVIVLLLTLGGLVSLSAIARKPAPAMVQLVDGRSVAMEPVDHQTRTPESIRRFLKESLSLMFTWTAKIPAANSTSTTNASATVNDPGIAIGNGRITTATWQASFSLKEDFRTPFLEQVAKMTPPSVFGSGAQAVLSFESVSDPKPIQTGEWQVDVVANLLIFDPQHPQGLAIPFNKSIFLRAIEPTTDPLPEQSTPIQKALYQVQQSGLQITEMHDLDIQQLNR